MTFEEIEQSLPNGFHDATLLQVTLDSVGRSATIKISVWVSLAADSDSELYRVGLLKAESISVFFLEPPDPSYEFVLDGRGLRASGNVVSFGQLPELDPLLRSLPSGASAYRFFLKDWNSFFYLAAGEATFAWED